MKEMNICGRKYYTYDNPKSNMVVKQMDRYMAEKVYVVEDDCSISEKYVGIPSAIGYPRQSIVSFNILEEKDRFFSDSDDSMQYDKENVFDYTPEGLLKACSKTSELAQIETEKLRRTERKLNLSVKRAKSLKEQILKELKDKQFCLTPLELKKEIIEKPKSVVVSAPKKKSATKNKK